MNISMNVWTNYIIADSLEQAVSELAENQGKSRLIAGGTDLLLDLQQNRQEVVPTLVDVSRIPELTQIEIRGNSLFIGAAVPVSEVANSQLVNEHAACVSEACGLIGGPQVRNTATLGGNVAHALPAADGMISLVAMDAKAEVANSEGRKTIPILKLFRGPGKSALKADRDVLVGFTISLNKPGQASAFSRVMRPQGVALPILNAAVWLHRDESKIKTIRIAVGPSGPVPIRATEAEKILCGRGLSDESLKKIKNMISKGFHFRSSAQRAGAEYRYQLCGVLLEDVLKTAWKQAGMVQVS